MSSLERGRKVHQAAYQVRRNVFRKNDTKPERSKSLKNMFEGPLKARKEKTVLVLGFSCAEKKLATVFCQGFFWCAAWPRLPAGLRTLSSCCPLYMCFDPLVFFLLSSSCPPPVSLFSSSSLARLLAVSSPCLFVVYILGASELGFVKHTCKKAHPKLSFVQMIFFKGA